MLHSQTSATPGRRGATRAAYDPDSPLLLVKKLIDENPRADLDEIQRLVRRAVGITQAHEARPFVDYATANLYERVEGRSRGGKSTPPKPRPAQTAAEKIQVQAEAAVIASTMRAEQKNAWRLEMPAPNGKAVGDCLGMEFSQFSGYYKRLGEGLAPTDKFRDKKNGDDIEAAQTWKG